MASIETPLEYAKHAGKAIKSPIVIVGGGIVGSALAAYLSEVSSNLITIIDNSFEDLRGSTGYAPGLVGQLNEIPVLTQLAKNTVSEYGRLPRGFDAVGGLEIADSPDGIAVLERRCRLAHDAGLSAQILTSAEAAKMVPQWHREDSRSKALYFPSDGIANPKDIVREYRRNATSRGVVFREAHVLSILQENGRVVGVITSSGLVKAERIVIAAGIWTAQLLEPLGVYLPIIPVAHPYAYCQERPHRDKPSPFVRWPERHIYARDHGSCDGLGSYDHSPISIEKLQSIAVADWEPSFDGVLAKAASVLPKDMNVGTTTRFNGSFAVTPDALPLAGRIHQIEGLWVASAVWITHAGGITRLITDLLSGHVVDEGLSSAVDPNRFKGQDLTVLKERSLLTYNNIYNQHEQRAASALK